MTEKERFALPRTWISQRLGTFAEERQLARCKPGNKDPVGAQGGKRRHVWQSQDASSLEAKEKTRKGRAPQL